MTTRKHAFYGILAMVSLLPIMRTKKSYFGAAMIVAIMFSASPARATSLYSTLGPSGQFDTGTAYTVTGSDFNNAVIASPFSVSTTATLTNALLGVGNFAGNNNPISLYVESNAGGVPGAILTTLTQVGVLPPLGTNSLTMFTSGGYTLTSGTMYWLVAVETDPATFQGWNFAYTDPNNNIAFNLSGSATGPWNQFFGTDVAFQINGTTSVPESGSSFLLLGASLLVVGAGRFAQRRLIITNGSAISEQKPI